MKSRLIKDKLAGKLMFLLTVFSVCIVFIMILGLYHRSKPILAIKPLESLLFSSAYFPLRGEFGLYPFIMGTLWVTGAAVAIAVPLSLLTAVYLSEYAPAIIRDWARPLIDLLAGIPSVIFGVWGILAIVPLVKDYVAPFLSFCMGRRVVSTGYSVLAAGVVLAIMIFPIIIHVSLEVFAAVSRDVREASLALGATKWQTVKHVVLRKGLPGIIAAVALGLSRAFGETMAVLMVAGNVPKVPSSILSPAYPLPALIANNYGEMLSVPLYDAALLFSALVLMVVVLFFSIISRFILVRVERSIQ